MSDHDPLCPIARFPEFTGLFCLCALVQRRLRALQQTVDARQGTGDE